MPSIVSAGRGSREPGVVTLMYYVRVSEGCKKTIIKGTLEMTSVSDEGQAKTVSLGIACLFIAWATLCTVSSKQVMGDVVDNSNFLFFLQGVVAIVVLRGLAGVGVVDKEVVSFDVRNEPKNMAIAISYGVNVACGLCSLYYVNLPAFGALKRLTIITCWLGEYFIFPTPHTFRCIPSLLLLMAGTLVAGWHDLEFSPLGYFFGVASSAGQGVAFVLSKTLQGPPSDKPYSLHTVLHVVYFNSLVSTAMMLCVITFTGWDDLLKPGKQHLTAWDATQLLSNTLLILLLNIVIFLDCTMNTPLTHAVAGNLKAAATTLSGILVFGTAINFLGGIGLLLNLVGGMWYSWVRIAAPREPHKKEDDAEPV
eukprot:TRINITY_DN1457_c0_g1_i1.p2 TRINITY_DN1457_c0_g1~~TRINITY_DN1457_c0_g1_i1.p2  ORF type:complete len:366 (+),score=86.88 TRINITY_DN1457_c0_g1_i1:1254-2351(+)